MSTPPVRFNLSKTRILTVDDNPHGMDILSQILLGFCVERTAKATTAEEAKLKLASEEFSLVIIDDKMPGQDGYDVIDHIRLDPRAINYTVPIIMTSANPTTSVILRARDAGANYVIAKPLVPGVLLAGIHLMANCNREFVTSDNYRGPDRRIKTGPPPEGIEERRADALRLMQTPERAMSQDEVTALFG
jgi:CheY-like chemotaxis protein